jgi:ABC-type multidrug transport system fused ATPase/permease subunit
LDFDTFLPANLCHAIYRVSHGGNDDDENDGGDLDYLVDCRGIILAYAGPLLNQHAWTQKLLKTAKHKTEMSTSVAGKQLLKPTNLQFERNHRYGVVGNNGVGKTTLLNRIASGEINGFPQNIKVLYIQHGTQPPIRHHRFRA